MNDVPIEILVVGLDTHQLSIVDKALDSRISVCATAPNVCEAEAIIAQYPDAIIMVYLDNEPEDVLRLISKFSLSLHSSFIVLSSSRDPRRIIQVMKAGAKDFAHIGDDNTDDITRSVTELSTLHEQSLQNRHGKIISVFGAKGGSGATTIAANLGNILQHHGIDKSDTPRKVVLLDFDMDMGDLSVFLDLHISYTYHELLDNMHRLDSDLLYTSLTCHSSGLYLISHNGGVDDMKTVAPADLTRMVSFLKQHFDFLIIDGLRGFSERCLSALDNSDDIIITITPDIPSLRNVHRSLQIFERLRYAEDHVHVVLNRYNKRTHITIDEMADALGRSISCAIANDFPLINKSVHMGATAIDLAPKSQVTEDFKSLGNLFVDAPKQKRRSFLPFRRSG